MKSHSTMEELHNSPPPTKIARLTDNTTDLKGKEKSPPPSLIKLDLGLGGDSGGLISRTSTSSSHERTGFTFLQLKEYEHQVLIYKHMAAGIPVPFNLVLPIWKSLASSYGAFYCNNSGAFPPPYLGCKGMYFDSRNNMEPEPGRCRRTDGKKWRCSKDVVPNQKYCEKHMHRGRNRSRKPVEITTTSQVDSTTNLSISFPLQLSSTTTTSATTTSTNTNPTINTNLGCSPKSVLQNGGTSISKEPSI